MNYQGKKFLSLPEQVQVNKMEIEQLKKNEYRTFTTQLAIENLTYLELNQLVENSRDVSVGDLIYGSDAYYGQVTRVGGSVVEFMTVGLMPAGPKGDQGDQGPRGLQGPQGIQGIPGEVQIKDLPGYNLGEPNLEGKENLGNGNYRIYNNNSIIVDYNVNSGIYSRSGTSNTDNYINLTKSITGYDGQVMTMKVIRVSGTGQVYPFIELGANFGANMNENLNEATVTKLLNNPNNLPISIYNSSGFSHTQQFKIQLEKGDTATPYTIPGQIPQYNDMFALKQQEAWITPTLLNGWVITSDRYTRYKKDSMGAVWVEMYVEAGALDTWIFTLPAGYRPGQALSFTGVSTGGGSASIINVLTSGAIILISGSVAGSQRYTFNFRASEV